MENIEAMLKKCIMSMVQRLYRLSIDLVYKHEMLHTRF